MSELDPTPTPDHASGREPVGPSTHHIFTLDFGGNNLQLRLWAPWTLLFGPSGSGKTTLLRGIAGVETRIATSLSRRDAEGSWQELAKRDEAQRAQKRQLSWAPQQASLFPHLTVRQNVAFGFRAIERSLPHGVGSPAVESPADLVAEVMQLFRLEALSARLPSQLSGGEAQRVNLARAFARPNCKLLLLDEPFAGTDRALRDELLPHMQTFLAARGIPVLSVSHDVEEALQLEAEVVSICAGRVVAQGPAKEVLAEERARMLSTLTRGLS